MHANVPERNDASELKPRLGFEVEVQVSTSFFLPPFAHNPVHHSAGSEQTD